MTVPERMLSLAIGREGQNARLAARLTGWRIDIRSDVSVAEAKAAVEPEAPEPETASEPVASDTDAVAAVEPPVKAKRATKKAAATDADAVVAAPTVKPKRTAKKAAAVAEAAATDAPSEAALQEASS